MKKKGRDFSVMCLLVLMSIVGAARTVWALSTHAEISDAVAAYPFSQTVYQSEDQVNDHALALGAMKKVRGVWAPEAEERLQGTLFQLTQQIDDGHSASEVFEFYHKRFENISARELFVCRQRACGSSNSWANDYFKIKELYGLDGDQYYSVFEVLDEDEHLNYVSVYTVTRGNKRVFAQLLWLSTQLVGDAAVAPNPDVILEQLDARGFYIVSGVTTAQDVISVQEEHLAALATAIKRRRDLRVRIVGHDYSGGDLAEQQQRSLDFATALQTQLIAEGVAAEKLEAHGVGSLAPAKREDDTTMRLEVLLVR